jgi:cellulose synthase operon protein C
VRGHSSALAARAAAIAALLGAAAAGCAGVGAGHRGAHTDDAALAPWQALALGRRADAERGFAARLGEQPDDLIARFGRATIAFDRGDGAAALDDYAAVLAGAARTSSSWGALLAPGAAARVLALDDDVPPRRRARAEAILKTLPGGGLLLPWQARLELARLFDRAARRAGDANALERGATGRGCAREVFEAGALGLLPHLDLDRPTGGRPASEWRPVIASGCRLSLVARDGRPGAQILRAAIEVPEGTYELLLDYEGEARVALDGGALHPHGSETRSGPRVTAYRARLSAGRHDLEVRVATQGGRAELALMLSPVGPSPGVSARFVDPRSAAARRTGAVGVLEALPSLPASPSLAPAGPGTPDAAGVAEGAGALIDYCLAVAAERVGDADQALTIATRLERRPRFASGLSLAGVLARNDPTRPAGFARDAGRGRLRAALAVDPGVARAWQTLAAVELEDDHTREAIEAARQATRAAPGWWAPELVLAHALRSRGLDWDADRALDRAATKGGPPGDAPCLLVEALLRRADDRRDLVAQARLEDVLAACDAESEIRIDRLRTRGDLAAVAAALRAALRLSPDRDDLAGDLAQALWASGHRAEALAELSGLVAREPHDAFLRVRLADAQAAAGQAGAARQTVRAALGIRPDAAEVRRAARAMGVPLPLDDYRIDGRATIKAFEASGHKYAAPAVVVLDRSVARVFADGVQMALTHEIIRVQSKDAIDRWGEVEVPPGAEILTLRTHKPDGTTREPEEIAGKDTISAANVAIGDYIEWETLETKPASGAFAPGFLGDRFYFQSFDAPLDRSEYVLVTPVAMPVHLDRRAGAPAPQQRTGPDGTTVTTFATGKMSQLFAERAAVPAIEYVPSVRAGSGLSFQAWTRYVREQIYGTARSSPALREFAWKLAADAKAAPGDHARLGAAIVKWVTENIEAADDLRDPATFTLARGRGNRLALVLALARELGVSVRPVLTRSRLVAEASAPTPVEELDDFSESIAVLDLGTAAAPVAVYVDPRLRHAAFGYLPPSLDGARTLALTDGRFGIARSTATADHRSVDVTIRLDEQGGGVAVATEDLTGWPALEWAELVDRLGADRSRLRQDFEQRWLGVQFPGARLRDLDVEVPKDAPGAGVVRVRYSFVSPQLAVKSDHEMKLQPTFFRSQPGRRFATEPQRSTTLMLGFDVPFRMTATVELPHAARLIQPGDGQGGTVPEGIKPGGVQPGGVKIDSVDRKGGYHFLEDRHLRAGSPEVLVLRRESTLPLMRVSPAQYAGVAADLRRVDGLEQQEIRIRLRAGRGVTK